MATRRAQLETIVNSPSFFNFNGLDLNYNLIQEPEGAAARASAIVSRACKSG
jgi:hypothetical protein